MNYNTVSIRVSIIALFFFRTQGLRLAIYALLTTSHGFIRGSNFYYRFRNFGLTTRNFIQCQWLTWSKIKTWTLFKNVLRPVDFYLKLRFSWVPNFSYNVIDYFLNGNTIFLLIFLKTLSSRTYLLNIKLLFVVVEKIFKKK